MLLEKENDSSAEINRDRTKENDSDITPAMSSDAEYDSQLEDMQEVGDNQVYFNQNEKIFSASSMKVSKFDTTNECKTLKATNPSAKTSCQSLASVKSESIDSDRTGVKEISFEQNFDQKFWQEDPLKMSSEGMFCKYLQLLILVHETVNMA